MSSVRVSSLSLCGSAHSWFALLGAASRPLIDRSIAEDMTIYPDETMMKTFYTLNAHDQKTQRLLNRLWTKIKTGK